MALCGLLTACLFAVEGSSMGIMQVLAAINAARDGLGAKRNGVSLQVKEARSAAILQRNMTEVSLTLPMSPPLPVKRSLREREDIQKFATKIDLLTPTVEVSVVLMSGEEAAKWFAGLGEEKREASQVTLTERKRIYESKGLMT